MKKLCKIFLLSMLAACTLGTLSSCGGTVQSPKETESPKDTTPADTSAETVAETVSAETSSETEAAETHDPTKPFVTPMNGEDGIDFIIEFPAGEELTVLQLTDTQMQELSGVRNENRRNQVGNAFFSHGIHDHETRVWRYMDEAVERSNPDLIVLTGDNIYGELDDDGSMWLELCAKMDSYGVPWLTVFGNHDNESGKGVMWQIEQLQNSRYGVFAQGEVTGNSNYNVVIKQGDEYKYLFYLLDTNGCSEKPHNIGEGMMPDNPDIAKITQASGIYEDQIQWMRSSAASVFDKLGTMPVMLFYHIPPSDVNTAVTTLYADSYEPQYIFSYAPFSADRDGDFGFATEAIGGGFHAPGFFEAAKEIGCVGMFMGHQHKVSVSMVYDGIRMTYGLKTGTYDYHESDMLGGTKITIGGDNSFTVEHLESELEYLG